MERHLAALRQQVQLPGQFALLGRRQRRRRRLRFAKKPQQQQQQQQQNVSPDFLFTD